jgi:hypothetical protein
MNDSLRNPVSIIRVGSEGRLNTAPDKQALASRLGAETGQVGECDMGGYVRECAMCV